MSRLPIKLTFGEEVANAITHGIASLLVLFFMPWVSIVAYTKGDSIYDVIGVTIFCVSIFLMFLMSTFYHIMEHETKHKKVMRIFDHIFIYVAIAGTYTPIAISVIGGWQAIVILSIQWAMVLFGILYKSISKKSMPKFSLTIYLIMGWTLIIFMPLFFHKANRLLFWLILAGGALYSAGAAIYARKGFKYHHMVWHLFVFLGALTHFIGICFFMYK
ncbi:PAQR family membrane homeostasis protein TrhA [Pseudobacteroides cellulosolvens]|uniref:Hly-III family protein n=1 Tax=Pseudobacteroides cellulosolvens ATCC 35603 = DSM 2933 TaxID=398512 RepID=A0A0L6JSK1_9FIRM|nr:hemolysin III family protein [Pseudobacteroides cellulosolvens]KNY28684.1 Hly-III family protein [Pseudobacteroides cellulosolvens ATCC 35603 = DSM 2933]